MFHYNNLEDSFRITLEELKQNAQPRIVSTSCFQVIEEYITANQHLDRRVGERLVIE